VTSAENKGEIMLIKDILEKYLKENGFDGLCWGSCGCVIGDLCPCESSLLNCEPAYKLSYDELSDDQKKFIDEEYDYYMMTWKKELDDE
jgi:hypothetical protein